MKVEETVMFAEGAKLTMKAQDYTKGHKSDKIF